MSGAKTGVIYACIAFVTYGIYPVYFKQLPDVPSLQLACHRVVWSFALLVPLFVWQVDWKSFRETALKPKVFATYLVSSLSLGGMWYLFLWGIANNYIVETSLGFFMNPVFSVLLAVVVLKERLRLWQWVSVALAILGCLVIAIAYGKFPWLAFSIAILLTMYGFVKSTAPLKAIEGVTIELGYLFLPALGGLIAFEVHGTGAFAHVSGTQNALLVLAGLVTVFPLLLFASAAHMISFSLLGLLQYIGPIMNFVIGVAIYHEPFSTSKLIGFILVWMSLALYTVEGIIIRRRGAEKETTIDSDVEKKDIDSVPDTPTTGFKQVEDTV
ncbi:unnamed protein product [Aphanomyces euteiches]|nr:hypothetical protein AeRB84_005454 [Aphanomyces euteiches]